MTGRGRWCAAVLAAYLLATVTFPVPAQASPPADTVLRAVDLADLPSMTATLDSYPTRCVTRSTVRADGPSPAQQMMRSDAVWPLSRGAGITIAVVDTGVAPAGVTALAGGVDTGLATTPGPASGHDCVGHGTFLAGLIAAATTTGSYFAGVAPQARILPIRATDTAGGTDAAVLSAAIRLATARHAQIILVGPGVYTPDAGLHAAVRAAVAHGSLVVAPATLDGQSQPGTPYPAGFAETLSDAGVDAAGAPASDEPVGAPVDLSAPGEAVVSIGPGGNGNFVTSSASAAAALAAGVAALVLAYHPGLDVAAIIDRLETTAYPPGGHVPDPDYGYGIVDPSAAVAALLPSPAALAHPGGRVPVVPAPIGQPERGRAVAIAGGSLTLMVLIVIGIAVLAPVRRRRTGRPELSGSSARRE